MIVKRREKVPDSILKKSMEDGVIQKDENGVWRIINRQKGVYWNSHYKTKEDALKSLRAYQTHPVPTPPQHNHPVFVGTRGRPSPHASVA